MFRLVAAADLIVQGTLVEVTDGIALHDPDSAAVGRPGRSYATFVIDVTEVLDGDPGRLTDGTAYVQVLASTRTTTEQLSELNPQASVVAVLADITQWQPSPTTAVEWPASVPADAVIYAPYADGMWLQGEADTAMLGMGVDPAELTPAWGNPTTVAEFAAAVEAPGATRPTE